MLHIKEELLKDIHTPAGLVCALQNAIELEHATIPPYLFGLYSLASGANQPIASAIQSVVCEEMLHMTLACNLFNAVSLLPPRINRPEFLSCYPVRCREGWGAPCRLGSRR